MTVYRATRHDLTQVLIRGDLEDPATLDLYQRHLPERIHAVSDPPWNPGNATCWRTHARTPRRVPTTSSWTAGARWLSCARSAVPWLCWSSRAPTWRTRTYWAAIRRCPGWRLRERSVCAVQYGSGAKMLPNALLHFGGP